MNATAKEEVTAAGSFLSVHFPEDQMTESKKLFVLRNKLVGRRRAIVASFQTASIELLTGDAIARIQNAIDAVDRAIADEKRAEPSSEDPLRLVPASSSGSS